ncbi:hypothetical protein CR152_11440 [Massilia violaceinigra]|uniref:Uncharacterized protein n=2 Tax=Massilia violaceinigra TaxID=2045208 RepID=A0A2D2DJC4_9BURK|nr:hypothetical protein CR152_11440 [Massilia violaceinigra]
MAPNNQAADDLLSKRESTAELDCDGVLVTPNERNTLLLIIAALAQKAGIDPAHHKSASAISDLISLLGASVSSPTIRDKLNMIPAAVARREVVVGRKRTGK